MEKQEGVYVCPSCGYKLEHQTYLHASSNNVSFDKPHMQAVPLQPLPEAEVGAALGTIRRAAVFAIALGSFDVLLVLLGFLAWQSGSSLASTLFTSLTPLLLFQAVLLLTTGFIIRQASRINVSRIAHTLSLLGFGLIISIALSLLLRRGLASLVEILHLFMMTIVIKPLRSAKRLQAGS